MPDMTCLLTLQVSVHMAASAIPQESVVFQDILEVAVQQTVFCAHPVLLFCKPIVKVS